MRAEKETRVGEDAKIGVEQATRSSYATQLLASKR